MTLVNPACPPSRESIALAAEIAENGGNLTAEEIERTTRWERCGWASSRTSALRMAGPDGAIFGKAGSWNVCRPRPPERA